ncbi:MAG: hypothetical protein HY606_02695, partial [Planctomycetes bacterium]|nr:hypothetical protein [Planctomycetota bacterium]
YMEELQKLPKGALILKIIKGHRYYYLERRENDRINYKYLGKPSNKIISKYIKAKELRQKYAPLLKRVLDQIKFLRHALNYGQNPG